MTIGTLKIRGFNDTEWRVLSTVRDIKFSRDEVAPAAPTVTYFDKNWNIIPADMGHLLRIAYTWTNPFLTAPAPPTARQQAFRQLLAAMPVWKLPENPFDTADWPTYEPDQSLHLVPYYDYHGRRKLVVRWYREPYWETYSEAVHRITTAERARWLAHSIPERNYYRAYLRGKGSLTLAEVKALRDTLHRRPHLSGKRRHGGIHRARGNTAPAHRR